MYVLWTCSSMLLTKSAKADNSRELKVDQTKSTTER